MNKSILKRLLICSVLVYLTGCSTFHSPFDGASFTNNDASAASDDITDSTDDVPYAIGQYLDQIRIANNNIINLPESKQNLASQK